MTQSFLPKHYQKLDPWTFLRFSAGISNNHPNSTCKLEETSRGEKFCNFKFKTELVMLASSSSLDRGSVRRRWAGRCPATAKQKSRLVVTALHVRDICMHDQLVRKKGEPICSRELLWRRVACCRRAPVEESRLLQEKAFNHSASSSNL